MRKIILSIVFMMPVVLAFAQLPATDIWLVDMKHTKGVYTFGTPIKITANPGYDNLPSFSQDGFKVIYTAVNNSNQADVYEYNIKDSTNRQITKTQESEYSPKYVMDGKAISIVRVDADNGQRFYEFAGDPENPSVLAPGMDSVAYYAWLDEGKVALAILNNGIDLDVYDVNGQTFELVAKNVGRCILNIPGSSDLLFTKKNADKVSIYKYDSTGVHTAIYADGYLDNEDYIISGDGKLYTGRDGILYMSDPALKKSWSPVGNFSKSVGNFYRMAISPDGKRLALVSYQGDRP